MNEKNMSVPGGYSASSILQVPSNATQVPIVAQSGGGGDPPSLLDVPNSAQSQPITGQMGGAQKTIQVFGESLVIRDSTERRSGGNLDFLPDEIKALQKWGFSDEMIETDKSLGHDFLDNLYNGDCVSDTGISLLAKCAPAQTVITQLAHKIMGELGKPLSIHGVRRSDGTRDLVAPAGPYSGATGTDDMFTTLPLSATGPSQILFACEGPTGTTSVVCPPCDTPTGMYCIPTDDRKTVIFGELVNKLINDIDPTHSSLQLNGEQKTVYKPHPDATLIGSDQIETDFKQLRDIKIGDLLVTYKIKKTYQFVDPETKKIYDSQLNEFMYLLEKMASFTKDLSSGGKNLQGVDAQQNPLVMNLTNEDARRNAQTALHILLTETDEEYYRKALFEIMGTGIFKDGLVDTNVGEFFQFIESYIQRFKIQKKAEEIEQDAIEYGLKAQEAEKIRVRLDAFRQELAQKYGKPLAISKSGQPPDGSAGILTRDLTPEEQAEVAELEQQLEAEQAEQEKAIIGLGKGVLDYNRAREAILGFQPRDGSQLPNKTQVIVPPISRKNFEEWSKLPDPTILFSVSSPPELTGTFINLSNLQTQNTINLYLSLMKDDLLKNPAKYDNKTYTQVIDSIITDAGIIIDPSKSAQINDTNGEQFLTALSKFVEQKFPPPPPTENDKELAELMESFPGTGVLELNTVGQDVNSGGLVTSTGISNIISGLPKSSTPRLMDEANPLVLNTTPITEEAEEAQGSQDVLQTPKGLANNIKRLQSSTTSGVFATQPSLTINYTDEEAQGSLPLPPSVNLNNPPASPKPQPMLYCVKEGKVFKIKQNDPELKGVEVYPSSSNKAEIVLDKALCKPLPEMPNTIDDINAFLENTMRLINPNFILLPQEFIRKPGTYAKSLDINVTKKATGNEAITIESIKQKNKNEIAIAGGSITEEFKDKLDDPHPNITIVNTIGDGTCLVHSFLLSVSSSYRRMSDEDRLKIGQIFRVTVLVSKTTNEQIKTRLENLSEFLTDIELNMLARIFKINIAIFIKRGSVKSIEIYKNSRINKFIIMYNNGTLHYSAVGEELRDEVYTFIFNNVDFIKQGENVLTLTLNNSEINKNKGSEATAQALLGSKGGSRRKKTRKIAYRDTPSYLLKKRLKTTKKAKRRSLSHK
jgi:uncharacterized protein (DUF1778 family)